MKKIGIFALMLGLITLSACGGSDKEATKKDKKEEKKEETTTCSASNQNGEMTVVIYDEDGKVAKFTVSSTMKYSEGMTKEEVEVGSKEVKNNVPKGMSADVEANDDSYTTKVEVDLAKIADEDLKQFEGSFPVANVKNGTVKDFVKGWEEKSLTCK